MGPEDGLSSRTGRFLAIADERRIFALRRGQIQRGWWFCATSSEKPPTGIVLGDSHANHLFPALASASRAERAEYRHMLAGNGLALFVAQCRGKPLRGTSQGATGTFHLRSDKPYAQHSLCPVERRMAGLYPRGRGGGCSFGSKDRRYLRQRDACQWSKSARQVPARPGAHDRIPAGPEYTPGHLSGRSSSVIRHSWLLRPSIPAGIPKLPVGRGAAAQGKGIVPPHGGDLRKTYPDLLVFDSFPVFCGMDTCRMRDGQTPLFRDHNHLSLAGSERVAARFRT